MPRPGGFAVAVAALLGALVLGPVVARAQPLPLGEHSSEVTLPAEGRRGPVRLTIHTYKPASYSGGALLLVFHGAQRNARTYMQSSRTLADRLGALLVAPLFEAARFPSPRYQGGGIRRGTALAPPGAWTVRLVPLLADEVRRREGQPGLPLLMAGHSAGSLFLMKLAALAPVAARGLLIANPSALLFPSRERAFPAGLGGLPEDLSDDAALRRYLAQPITFLIGARDRTQRPFRGQAGGPSDFDRAVALGRQRGWTVAWQRVEVPDTGHDHKRMFQHPLAAQALGAAP